MKYALHCLGWLVVQIYRALWDLVKGTFIGLMVVGMGLLIVGAVVTAFLDLPSQIERCLSAGVAGAGAGGALILFAYDFLGEYVYGGRFKGAVIGALGGLLGALFLFVWEPWASEVVYYFSGFVLAAIGGGVSGWLLGIHPGVNPFPPPWESGDGPVADFEFEQLGASASLPSSIRWNQRVQERYVRFLLRDVQPRSWKEYKDMFWHQASDIGRKRFREEVFDYQVAPEVESAGIDKGTRIALSVARARKYSEPRALKEAVAKALRKLLNRLGDGKPSSDIESSFMYRDGVEKVLAEFEERGPGKEKQ